MRSTQADSRVRRIRVWGRSQPIALIMDDVDDHESSASSVTVSDANFSRFSMSQLTTEIRESTLTGAGSLPPDAELLRRARAAHANTHFSALVQDPQEGGAWKCVETDNFSIYRRNDTEAGSVGASRDSARHPFRPEVLCAGRLDASIDEVAQILSPSCEAEYTATSTGLYGKGFIFGSIEREVKCVRCNRYASAPERLAVDGEKLTVKTSSFVHTALFGYNEQWCYLDFFQRKPERDGFSISQRALRPDESTVGRIKAGHARVHQLHGLAASYLVDQLPGRRGLLVVFHSWFDPVRPDTNQGRRSSRRRSFSDSTLSTPRLNYCSEAKAQARRLLALARGVAQLPACVRQRRFSIQLPQEVDAAPIDNARCPCCTCGLSTVKLTLATGLLSSDWRRLNMKRCYLCGYLVCGACWSTAQMENDAGRAASIVACTRCQACLETQHRAESNSLQVDE